MNGLAITVNMRAEALLSRVLGSHDRLMSNLRIVVQRLAIKAQGTVKQDKLSGQVLHVRTGTLRRSINQKLLETGTGVYGQIGTNVKYAAIHEFGFDGVVNVEPHARRSALQMSAKRSKRVSKGDGEIFVQEHTRHMHMPKRSFLLSTLQDMAPEIRTTLRASILQTVVKP